MLTNTPYFRHISPPIGRPLHRNCSRLYCKMLGFLGSALRCRWWNPNPGDVDPSLGNASVPRGRRNIRRATDARDRHRNDVVT